MGGLVGWMCNVEWVESEISSAKKAVLQAEWRPEGQTATRRRHATAGTLPLAEAPQQLIPAESS